MITWPETDNAVHTMPAMAITKNMPEVPETPNFSSTIDDTMMVNMVIAKSDTLSRLLEELMNSDSLPKTTKTKLAKSRLCYLTDKSRASILEKTKEVYDSNAEGFANYRRDNELKASLLLEIDNIEDRLSFEMLALEFFGFMK